VLEAALKSSGNMLNPKVLPLHFRFSECFLQTPTLKKMNQILATHVSPVNEISFGKFFTEKEGEWPKISRHGLADA
jgi:hypothetical protein